MNIFPTNTQLRILNEIKSHPGKIAREIADWADYSKANIYVQLLELTEKELIRKEEAPNVSQANEVLVPIYFITDWGIKVLNLSKKAPTHASISSIREPAV